MKITLVDAKLGPDCEAEVLVVRLARPDNILFDSYNSQFLDGWELNGNILPSLRDHSLPLE